MAALHGRGHFGLLSLALLCLSWLSGAQASSSPLPLPQRVLHQFPLGTWIENLYVRPNGDILISIYSPNASVYLISNPSEPTPNVTLLHTFVAFEALLGITETKPDVFAVVGLNSTGPAQPVNGSSSVWELDLRYPSGPRAHEITSLPEALLVNSVDVTPGSRTTILISDSGRGLVWRVNMETGSYDIAVSDPAMVTPAGAALNIGINGMHVRGGFLYWVNSFERTIYRVRITPNGGRAPGATVETVAKALGVQFIDDFAFGPEGRDTIWGATNLDNMLVAMQPGRNGTRGATVVDGAADQLTLGGDTACAFGKGAADKKILYVVTSGAVAVPVNGTESEGGKIVAVDTKNFVSSNC